MPRGYRVRSGVGTALRVALSRRRARWRAAPSRCRSGNRRALPVRPPGAQPSRITLREGQGHSRSWACSKFVIDCRSRRASPCSRASGLGCGRGTKRAGQPDLSQVRSVARRREGACQATGSRPMGGTHAPCRSKRFLGSPAPAVHAARVAREPASFGPVSLREGRAGLERRKPQRCAGRSCSFSADNAGAGGGRHRSGPSAVKARGSPWSHRPRQSRRVRVLFDNRDCRLSVLRTCLPVRAPRGVLPA